MTWKASALAAVLAAVLLGCGGDEARLEELTEKLDDLRESVARAEKGVEEKAASVQEAERDLSTARDALRETELELAAVEREIAASATDPVLFRMIQKRLLEDAALEDVAISARVQNGVAALSGTVPNEELRTRAVEIARGVPGVLSVESRIQVAPAVGAPPPSPED